MPRNNSRLIKIRKRRRDKLTRSKAIRAKCLDCAGGTSKEATLCHVFNCPLWQYRFANSLKSSEFTQRMDGAKKRFPKEFAEIKIILLEGNMRYYHDIQDKDIQVYVAQLYGIKPAI